MLKILENIFGKKEVESIPDVADHSLDVYGRLPIKIAKGDGVWLFDTNGNKILDGFAGIAVSVLGYNNPVINKVIRDQSSNLIHISNLVEIPQQVEICNMLAERSGFDARVFISNSGTEAIEVAIKLSRLYGHSKNIAEPKVIAMEKAFHGRSMGAISAGGSAKCRDGFEPLLDGFVRVPFNDPAAIEKAAKENPDVVAVLIEPIQGEGGIFVPDEKYLSQVRKICDDNNLLMMLDEIQTGVGRTGKFFCYQHSDILPDVVCLAKALANGVPIGATIIRSPYFELFKPGSHGSTFGGNPLSCAVACATITELEDGGWIENAEKQGKKIVKALKEKLGKNEHVIDVRGMGLMIGIELDRPSRDILKLALKKNIIFNVAGTHVVRLLPPLIIDDHETEHLIQLVAESILEYVAT